MTITDAQRAARLLWADALESGYYTQATGALHEIESDGYCCLGVAGDICPDVEQVNTGGEVWVFMSPDGDESLGFLPHAARKWLGLPSNPYAWVEGTGTWEPMSVLNDLEGYTLSQIAQIIREQDPEWDGRIKPNPASGSTS